MNIYSKLFTQECELYWRLSKTQLLRLPAERSYIRLEKVCGVLEKKATELNLPVQFLISAFAYFYVDVFRMNSYNMIQLKLSEFYERATLDLLPKFTQEDVDLAYKIRDTWFTMNKEYTVSSLPFRLRPFYQKQHIKVGRNTFFDKSYNFVAFTAVAHFINTNRLNYPEMHGLVEFFFHLPIVYGPKVYHINLYSNPVISLETYYTKVYKIKDKHIRYSKFLNLAKPGVDYSELWCSEQLKKDTVSSVL